MKPIRTVVAFIFGFILACFVMQALFVMRGCNHPIDEAKTSSDVSIEETKIFSDIKSEYKHYYEDLREMLHDDTMPKYFQKLIDGTVTPSEFFHEEKTVDILILGTQSPLETARLYSVYLLGRTINIKSFHALEKVAMSDGCEKVKNAALAKLGRMNKIGNSLPVIKEFLELTHQRQQFAIRALAYMDSKEALELLFDYFNKSRDDESMKKVVLKSIALYRGIPEILSVIPFLVKALDEPSEQIREVAYLGLIGHLIKDIPTDIIPEKLIEGCIAEIYSVDLYGTGLPVILDEEVRKELHQNWMKYSDALKKWCETNKDYFVVFTDSFAPEVFRIMVYQKAKAAGIPAKEYIKAYPPDDKSRQVWPTVDATDSGDGKDKK